MAITFKDFLRESKEALKELWVKIWGEDLPKDMTKLYPDEEYNLGEQIRYYEEDKKELSKRRTKVSIALIIIFLIGFNIFKNIFEYVRTSEFVSCFGKDICIYRGPKLNYPSYFYVAEQTADGNIFIYSQPYNYFFNMLKKHKIFYNFFLKKNDQSIVYYESHFPGYQNRRIEYYDITRKKINKLKTKDKDFNRGLDILDRYNGLWTYGYYTHCNNDVILLNLKDASWRSSKHSYVINIKKPQFTYKKNIFHAKNNDFNLDFEFITKYDDKTLLIMGYKKDTQYYTEPFFNGYIKDNQENNYSRLYLFNIETEEIKPLPEYQIKPKYHPYPPDVKVFNGTIIVPIRGSFGDKTSNFQWDHIEIYNPKTNKFYVETNVDVLDDNLFDIELSNDKILYINRNSSYIFDTNFNQFEKVSDYEFYKNKNLVNKISKNLSQLTQCNLKKANNDRMGDYSKILKLENGKFLIFCGDYYSENEQSYKLGSKETVYFDYSKNIVKKGPNFIYPYMLSRIIKINNKQNIVLGGLTLKNKREQLPNLYTQIIKIK